MHSPIDIRAAVQVAVSYSIYKNLKQGQKLGKQLPALTLYRIAKETGLSVEEVGEFKW